MPTTPCSITIVPPTLPGTSTPQSVSVTIASDRAGASPVTAYTSENGSSAATWPATVATTTTYWLTAEGSYYVSALTPSGQQVASKDYAVQNVSCRGAQGLARRVECEVPTDAPTASGTALLADTTFMAGVATSVVNSSTASSRFALIADPTFTGSLTLTGRASITKRTVNGTDDNVLLLLGTSQAVTDQVNQHYIATISPAATANVDTTGAGAAAIGFNIGQWIVNATDGASNLTRTGEFANIEADFIQFQQTGGTAVFNKAVNTRFRLGIPKTGVTIVDNKGIDFVIPDAGDVTGSVTNYIAINIPAMTGGGGTNFYGIRFDNEPANGSIVSRNGHLTLTTLTASTDVKLTAASGGGIVLEAGNSGGNITLTPGVGGGYVRIGTAAIGAVGSAQIIPSPGSPISIRQAFGTDGSGYKMAWAKNVAGTVTDLLTLQDNGDLTLLGASGKITAPGNIASSGTVSGGFAVTSGGNISSSSGGSHGVGTTQYGGGTGVLAIQNAPTVPSTNPTNAGVIYVEAGALKYRGSSGTVTVLAAA